VISRKMADHPNMGVVSDIESQAAFHDLLGKVAGALVVTHFWASWAPQCVHLNEVLGELSAKYPYVSFVKVEAESVPDLSEEQEISAVPTFLFFKNKKRVDRLDGADVAALSKKVAQHAQSTTASIPAAAPTEDLNKRLKALINASKCMVFMKGTPNEPRCKFSRALMELLKTHHVDFMSFNILDDEKVRQGLKAYSNWPTYPQVYAGGELVGGLDIVQEMIAAGDFFDLVPHKEPLNDRLEALVKKAPIMLFMKGNREEPRCGFSKSITGLLTDAGITYETFDILEDDEVRQGLKTFSNWPTYPQLYVRGELIGGLDIVREMYESGELLPLVNES